MGLAFKRTMFSLGVGGAASTVVVPHGLATVPKFLYLMWNGRTNTTDAQGLANHFRGIGMVGLIGGTTYRAVGNASEHNIATATRNSKCMLRDDAAIVLLTNLGAVDGLAGVQSVDATNVTFVINDAFSIDLRCQMVAIGGTDLTNVFLGTLTSPIAGTPPFTTDYTPSGLTPVNGRGLLITLGCKSAVVNTVADDSDLYHGFATGLVQRTTSSGANHNNAATTKTNRYSFSSETIAQYNAADAATVGRAAFNAWIAGGFQLNWLEVSDVANLIGYAILVGPKFGISVGNMPSVSGNTVLLTGVGFQAIGGILYGAGATQAQDTLAAEDTPYMGAWDGVGSEGAFHTNDVNGQATSIVATRVAHAASFARVNSVGNSNGTCQLQSVTPDGCSYINTQTGTGGDVATVFFGPSEDAGYPDEEDL